MRSSARVGAQINTISHRSSQTPPQPLRRQACRRELAAATAKSHSAQSPLHEPQKQCVAVILPLPLHSVGQRAARDQRTATRPRPIRVRPNKLPRSQRRRRKSRVPTLVQTTNQCMNEATPRRLFVRGGKAFQHGQSFVEPLLTSDTRPLKAPKLADSLKMRTLHDIPRAIERQRERCSQQ